MNDKEFLLMALEKAKLCKPTGSAYSVGCLIVKDGKVISIGYSREDGLKCHAEEAALKKVDGEGSTVYTTMEPCSKRASREISCVDEIIGKRVSRVVFGCREPNHFQKCQGVDLLREAGIEVVQIKELANVCLRVSVKGTELENTNH